MTRTRTRAVRGLLGPVSLWIATVCAVGGLTWLVISGAGRAVGQVSAERPSVVGSFAPQVLPSTAASSSGRPSASSPPPTAVATPTTAAPEPSARPQGVSRTFTADGGTVVVTCVGADIALQSVRPLDGWRFERETSGDTIEVKFSAAGETEEQELHLGCAQGVPVLRAGD